MIDLNFHTADGDILIQICTPVPTPDARWPVSIDVRTNGRSQVLVGNDPLEAIRLAAQFASTYLSGREGLDPPVNEQGPQAPEAVAQAFREGLFAVLDARGVACPEDARAGIASCADAATLQRYLRRAKTAASVDEVFADAG